MLLQNKLFRIMRFVDINLPYALTLVGRECCFTKKEAGFIRDTRRLGILVRLINERLRDS